MCGVRQGGQPQEPKEEPKMVVKYPDDCIRETRSIVSAAEMTYITCEDGEFVVACGDEEWAFSSLGDALDHAATSILCDGPVSSVEFTQNYPQEWCPNVAALKRELAAARRNRK